VSRFMIAGRMCHTRQPTFADQPFVCLWPHWDRIIRRGPVSVGRFVTPLSKPRHDLRMRSGASKSPHGALVLPNGQSPEGPVSIHEKSSSDKALRAHQLALSKKGPPKKRRDVPQRPDAKPSDGGYHTAYFKRDSEAVSLFVLFVKAHSQAGLSSLGGPLRQSLALAIKICCGQSSDICIAERDPSASTRLLCARPQARGARAPRQGSGPFRSSPPHRPHCRSRSLPRGKRSRGPRL
jgi:hypothetical protein